MPWWRPSSLVLLAGLLALGGCTRPLSGGPPSPAAPGSTPAAGPVRATPTPLLSGAQICIETVVIQEDRLIPETLTVQRNCVVLFSNRGEAVVQIQGHDFLLGEMGKDQSWAHTYREPGTFDYFNTKKPAQRGKVIVLP